MRFAAVLSERGGGGKVRDPGNEVALFQRLGLPSTLIRHENRPFRKRSSNWRNLKTPALRFSVDGKYFETELFQSKT